MLQARYLIEHQILWQTRKGNSNIWCDNWTTLRELYSISEECRDWDDRYQQVSDLVREGSWTVELIKEIFSEEIDIHSLEKIKSPRHADEEDRPIGFLNLVECLL